MHSYLPVITVVIISLVIKLSFRIPLKTDSFKLGRFKGDYLIKESDVGKDMIGTISSIQCEIIKNKDGVFLRDYSSNGKSIFPRFSAES